MTGNQLPITNISLTAFSFPPLERLTRLELAIVVAKLAGCHFKTQSSQSETVRPSLTLMEAPLSLVDPVSFRRQLSS